MGEQMEIGCQMAFNDFTSPKYIAEASFSLWSNSALPSFGFQNT